LGYSDTCGRWAAMYSRTRRGGYGIPTLLKCQDNCFHLI